MNPQQEEERLGRVHDLLLKLSKHDNAEMFDAKKLIAKAQNEEAEAATLTDMIQKQIDRQAMENYSSLANYDSWPDDSQTNMAKKSAIHQSENCHTWVIFHCLLIGQIGLRQTLKKRRRS